MHLQSLIGHRTAHVLPASSFCKTPFQPTDASQTGSAGTLMRRDVVPRTANKHTHLYAVEDGGGRWDPWTGLQPGSFACGSLHTT